MSVQADAAPACELERRLEELDRTARQRRRSEERPQARMLLRPALEVRLEAREQLRDARGPRMFARLPDQRERQRIEELKVAVLRRDVRAHPHVAVREHDLVHALVAEKLAPVVENAVAAAAANSAGDRTGDRAGDAGNVGGRSSTRLAQKKATQGGRVAKELNPRSKGVVNKFIRDWVAVHPDDGIFRKKQYWQIRRQCWGTFLDHVCSRAVLSVDENSFINLQKKAAPAAAAARAPLVVPSSTIRSPTPPAAGPSAAGPSSA